MAGNRFEDSRISEGTLQPGAAQVGEIARASVPEQIRTDQEPGSSPASRLSGEREAIRERHSGHDSDAGASPAPESNIAADKGIRHYRRVLSAGSLVGDRVRNSQGEPLGKIEQIMVDVVEGRVAYAVLSFGGFLGIGDKLFAVPWSAMRLDEGEQEFVLNVDRRTLETAPGFDKDNWPDMADPTFGSGIDAHYGQGAGRVGGATFQHAETDAGDYIGDNRQSNRSQEFEPTVGYRSTPDR